MRPIIFSCEHVKLRHLLIIQMCQNIMLYVLLNNYFFNTLIVLLRTCKKSLLNPLLKSVGKQLFLNVIFVEFNDLNFSIK